MKISVYAICKNEEMFVNRWMESMSEADEVYVLDTGSTDNTVELLKQNGAIVHEASIIPWRFDVARNKSLELVSKDTDICVCTDLDEVFTPGWRKALESVWTDSTDCVSYKYVWSFDEDGKEKTFFNIEKIHKRIGFQWVHPVHEVLQYIGNEQKHTVYTDKIILNHFPDNNKSRAQYLELLELSVTESPDDDRNMHYLGREYYFRGMWEKSIETLEKHLLLKSANWRDERCASMRYIAMCYINLEKYTDAQKWYEIAIKEAPYLREPYIEYAMLEYRNKNWNKVIHLLQDAIKIIDRKQTYITQSYCWDSTPYDLLSNAYYNIGEIQNALIYAQYALSLDENNERLNNNVKILKRLIGD